MLLNRSEQRRTTVATPERNFSQLVGEVISVARQQATLAGAIEVILTLDGRISTVDAYGALAPESLRLLDRYGDRRIFIDSPSRSNGAAPTLVLAISGIGRPILALAAELPEECQQVAQLAIDRDDANPVRAFSGLAEDPVSSDLEKILPQSDGADLLLFLDVVEFAIDHVDPVILYVGETTFTNFDSFNNLLARPAIKRPGYVLTDLRSRALQDWSFEEKILVASAYLLAKAGVRIEELNGQQITLPIVETLLRERYAQLSQLAGIAERPLDLVDLPSAIAGLRKAIRSRFFAYRTVNGLTFNKHEHYLERAAVDVSLAAVPLALAARFEIEFGCRMADFATIDEYFGGLTALAFETGADASGRLTRYERLFELIVGSAIAGTGAEIGMTRGVRDMRQWAKLCASGEYDALCAMPPTDYYCAVFTSEETAQTLRASGRYSKVLTAIAQRMTFNSWHYTPGHVPFDQVPRDRHFYVPPKMCDLAVWSDRHHQGHILANVRYSIRSPGGLMVNGRKQHGLFDIRLMRSAGDPFSMDDLLCARRHTAYVRAVLQASLDRHTDDPSEQIVRAFTKEYYRNA